MREAFFSTSLLFVLGPSYFRAVVVAFSLVPYAPDPVVVGSPLKLVGRVRILVALRPPLCNLFHLSGVGSLDRVWDC
jgi:hypothetical protein